MAALRAAVTAGAHRVELDIHHTADRRLVVHHDYLASARDGTPALIFQTEFASLAGPESGEPLLLLEDALDAFGDGVGWELELKGFRHEFLDHVVGTIRGRRLLGRTEFTSYRDVLFPLLHALEPGVTCGMFVRPFPGWSPEALGMALLRAELELGRFRVAHLPVAMVTEDRVEALHAWGFAVHAANVNDDAALDRVFRSGVDQISTDQVERAVAALERVRQDRRATG